ncbi:MAG: TerB family tellurite resistance protein [Microscillaceae bacterium]|nr:TerB family tellurite resistance protein [Microscillaceae bacterium]MDW8460630.1 hypothetical protein [Cytophagales bacterium]
MTTTSMTNFLTYNQAVFGLLLLGAKADGKLQDEEKRLIVEITSEEHHLSADEYKNVITESRVKPYDVFLEMVLNTLNTCPYSDRVRALYCLKQLIEAEDPNSSTGQSVHEDERRLYDISLQRLKVQEKDILDYARQKSL